MFFFLQVKLTQTDILTALSDSKAVDRELMLASCKTMSQFYVDKLFTKNGTLKKPLGGAHKGWTLQGFGPGSKPIKKVQAVACGSRVSCTLNFLRRKLGLTYESKCSLVSMTMRYLKFECAEVLHTCIYIHTPNTVPSSTTPKI